MHKSYWPLIAFVLNEVRKVWVLMVTGAFLAILILSIVLGGGS